MSSNFAATVRCARLRPIDPETRSVGAPTRCHASRLTNKLKLLNRLFSARLSEVSRTTNVLCVYPVVILPNIILNRFEYISPDYMKH